MKRTVILVALSLFSILFAAGCSTNSAPTSTSLSPSSAAPILTAAASPSVVPSAAPSISASKPSALATTAPVSTQVSKYGGTLRWIAGSGPGAPMGAPLLANGTSVFGMQFAEQFLLKEMQDGSLLPGLASSYDVNNDPANPSITLHL